MSKAGESHGVEVHFVGIEMKSEADRKFAVFTLEVQKEGAVWPLQKRYSDFLFFKQQLDAAIYSKLKAPFPAKSLATLTAEQVEQRKRELAVWFAAFLALPITPRVRHQLFSFLRVLEHTSEGSKSEGARKYPGAVIKTGYLTKLGGNKSGGAGNWKFRFMVLSDDLVYYQSEDAYQSGGAPKGRVSLNTSYCPDPDPTDESLEFTLYALPYELTVRAASREEMAEWVETFQKLQSI
ncbi:hypothetical protein M885DRAFT_541665 [Pelagophyceae sp. CCMP2097]|nr:hypothetical protein M885DRAFT_541665 [Pelagophyceae sp. CCMP2097]